MSNETLTSAELRRGYDYAMERWAETEREAKRVIDNLLLLIEPECECDESTGVFCFQCAARKVISKFGGPLPREATPAGSAQPGAGPSDVPREKPCYRGNDWCPVDCCSHLLK